MSKDPIDELREQVRKIVNGQTTKAEYYDEAVLEQTDQIMQLVQSEVVKAQTNAVAWAVGVLDELHGQNPDLTADRVYKGAKNTLRDRYKVHTNIDPAPDYPVKAELILNAAKSGEEKE